MKCLILVSLLAVAYAQQCGKQWQAFRSCVKKADGTQPPQPKPYPGGSVSADVKACFTRGQCQQPQLIGEQASGSEALMGALIKCSDKVKDAIRPIIQRCLDSTPNVGPGFVLHPDLIAPLPLTMPNPPPAPPAVVILHSVSQVYNDQICNPRSHNTVKNCIVRVHNKFIPTPANQKSPIESAFELTKHCYNQEACKQVMTETCKSDIENLRAYICNCAKTTFANSANVQAIVRVFQTCVQQNAGAAALQRQSVTTFSQYAQRLVTNLMCLKAPDPCKPPEQPQGGAGGPPQQG